MSRNVSGPLRSGPSTGAWSALFLLRRSVAPRTMQSNALSTKKMQGEWIAMRRSFGPSVDVGASSKFSGIQVMYVFWWAFFTESLSGTASAVTPSV
jgi:hypothetical protein